MFFLPENKNVDSNPYFEITAFSKQRMNNYENCLLSGSMDYDVLVNENGILVDDSTEIVNLLFDYDVEIGDVIEIQSVTGEKIPFTVMGTIDLQKTEYAGAIFYIPEKILPEIIGTDCNPNKKFFIQTNFEDIAIVEEYVFDLLKDNQDIQVESFLDAINYTTEQLAVFREPLYGLVIFVGLFGAINLINTLMTNFMVRKREYGVLSSIGLSKKQLFQMLRIESFYYILGTIIITLSIGTLAGYILCKVFNQIGILGTLNYHFPIIQAIAFMISLMGIWFLYVFVVKYISRKINLVEAIKGED